MSTHTTTHLPTRRAILLAPVIAALAAGCVAALMLAGLLTGCGQLGEGEPERVDEWIQDGAGSDWVSQAMPIPSEVIASDDELAAWIDRLDAEPGTFDSLDEVDLSTHAIVVVGFYSCQATSSVRVTRDGNVDVDVVQPRPRVDCAWTPYMVDAWAVPLTATGGEPPELVDD
jgi:hypothetical protein